LSTFEETYSLMLNPNGEREKLHIRSTDEIDFASTDPRVNRTEWRTIRPSSHNNIENQLKYINQISKSILTNSHQTNILIFEKFYF